ncbi:MAG: YCF48-related protein [Cyclobacteriaceae bacterium]|nr:YCF48-related protein [Cyclobacteriaceae bacterium]
MPLVVYLLLIFACQTFAQSVEVVPLRVGVPSSFRALSVVNNKVAWVAGSNGYIGRTTDGGATWQFSQVNGFESLDFRSLHALNRKQAIIANAGTPAHILLTADGGKTWKSVYTNTHADAFIDGIDFWNRLEGMIYGDPVDSRMLLLRTTDGGKSWKPVKQPPQLAGGEASFAASGTGIRCFNKSSVVIATGGAVSRLWYSADKGETWKAVEAPVIQGENSTGIFSVGIRGNTWIIAGGNYQQPSRTERHIYYSTDAGKTWQAPMLATRGYRECVEHLNGRVWVAVGPTGAEVSVDNGNAWNPLSDEPGFHTVRKARKGSLTLVVGNGKLHVLKLQGR